MYVPVDALWEVSLTAPHAKGSKHIVLLNTEPEIRTRQAKMPLIDTSMPGHEERHEQQLRKSYNIPDDALVQDHWIGNYTLKERVITWYEITT